MTAVIASGLGMTLLFKAAGFIAFFVICIFILLVANITKHERLFGICVPVLAGLDFVVALILCTIIVCFGLGQLVAIVAG